MHAKTPPFLMKIQYDFFDFIFEKLGRMQESKTHFFFILQCFDENWVF